MGTIFNTSTVEYKTIKSGILDIVLNLVVIALLVFIIRGFIISPIRVSGPSMCNTLNVINGECVESATTIGEHILINKFVYLFSHPKRGDVVVLRLKELEDHYIKRVIGIPGDTIEIGTDGFVYLTPENGVKQKLNETYLNDYNYGNTKPSRDNLRTFTVPESKYFIMGDNRAHSSDSRVCFNLTNAGCLSNIERAYVDESEIKGKAFVTLWPIPNIKHIKGFDYNLSN